jgi:hypothetical protein
MEMTPAEMKVRIAELEAALIDICEHSHNENLIPALAHGAELVGRELDYYHGQDCISNLSIVR